jgi:single-strand DNA-binding protein
VSRSLNKAILIGNVGADPEVRSTSGGSRFAQFNLATGYRKKDGSEVTHWHRIVAWERPNAGGGDPFNAIERFVKKGSKLYVEGEIEYRSYEDKDGVTKYITEIRPRELLMLSGAGEGGGGGGGGGGGRPAAAGAGAAKGGYDDYQAPPFEEDDDLPF